jgi:Flp pilus assembly protein TadD
MLAVLPQCAEKTGADYVRDGIEYTHREDYPKAVESFLKAIDKNPKDPEAYVGLGGIYNQKKMFADALTAFETAIRLDPTHADAYYSLGYTHEMLGNREAAELNYEKSRAFKKRLDDLIEKEREKS